MKNILKKIYQATIGKKTIIGGICVVAGSMIPGPLGIGLGRVGELILMVGLGDKAARGIFDKIKQK